MFDRRVAMIGVEIDHKLEAERWKKGGNPRRLLGQLLRDDTLRPGERASMSYDELVNLTRHTAKVRWE